MNASLTTSHKHAYEWCVILPQTSVSFPENFNIQRPTSLCPCKHKIVQAFTNLVEPWQVGDQRLPLLHEIVPYGKFQETILQEKERCHYLPLRTQTFQTIEIYLTNAIGPLLSRCTTLQTSSSLTNSFYNLLTRDASRDLYPKNSAAHFKMQLTIQLNQGEDSFHHAILAMISSKRMRVCVRKLVVIVESLCQLSRRSCHMGASVV